VNPRRGMSTYGGNCRLRRQGGMIMQDNDPKDFYDIKPLATFHVLIETWRSWEFGTKNWYNCSLMVFAHV
jgi:hypothetical protein